MHEYFHVLLGHDSTDCAEGREDLREAEATYGAMHYLVPLHTYDLVARGAAEKASSYTELVRHVARLYEVSEAVIEQYEHERLTPLDLPTSSSSVERKKDTNEHAR
jgi:Domain of unknown function (DUF955).